MPKYRSCIAFLFSIACCVCSIGSADDKVDDHLKNLASSSDVKLRVKAAIELGEMGPSIRTRAEAALQTALADSSSKVRIAVAKALLRIDGVTDDAVKTLLEVIRKESQAAPESDNDLFNEDPMNAAIQALGEFGEDAIDAVAPLTKLLESERFDVRLAAAGSLGEFGPAAREAIPQLSKAMRETESRSFPFVHHAWSVGENAAIALGSIGVDAVPNLLKALQDPEPVVQARAARELGRIYEAAAWSLNSLIALLQRADTSTQVAALKAIRKFGREGNAAAPHIAKLLVRAESLTSFPSGSGIGKTESISAEAFQALIAVQPTADQVLPSLVESLSKTSQVTYEAITILLMFPDGNDAAKVPLERLLITGDPGAAAALSAMGIKHEKIKQVLFECLLNGENVNALAAIGIGHLASQGEKFDDSELKQLREAAAGGWNSLSAAACLFEIAPTDSKAAAKLVTTYLRSHYVFESVAIADAKRVMLKHIKEQTIQSALLQSLESLQAEPKKISEMIAIAELLILGRVEWDQALYCLEQLAPKASSSVIDVLVNCRANAKAISILQTLLGSDDRFSKGGDFYGNGGEVRAVGHYASSVLIRIGGFQPFASKLEDPNALVRVQVVRAIRGWGRDAFTRKLLNLVEDIDPRVRAEVAKTLVHFGDNYGYREVCLPSLRTLSNDRRKGIRDFASATIERWK